MLSECLLVLFVLCTFACLSLGQVTPRRTWHQVAKEFDQAFNHAQQESQLYGRYVDVQASGRYLQVNDQAIQLPPGWLYDEDSYLRCHGLTPVGRLLFINETLEQTKTLVFQVGGGTYVWR